MRAASVAPAAVVAAVVSAASLLLGAGLVSWGVTPAGARALPGTVPEIAAPSRTAGATTALVVNAVEARSLPAAGHRVIRVGTATDWSQQPETLLVLGSRQGRSGQWLRVLLGVRPNGLSGWIPRADVLLSRTRVWITLDKHSRMVSVYRRGRLLRRFEAVIGKPATPTPDGLAAIYERDRQGDPGGFLGPWALPLTLFSDVLTNYGGGPGRIAIHGRGGASLADPLGSTRSHGCIRVDNDEIEWLATLAAQGTPFLIAH